MILWLLFLSVLSISAAPTECCYDQEFWSCPSDVSCSCSSFNNSCYFTTGDDSCYVYATCECCIQSDMRNYTHYCLDCSCTNFTGAAYTTDMNGYCYVYEPQDEVGCCNNQNEFQFTDNPFKNYSCKGEGLCKMDTDDACWVLGPCSYEGCCLVLDPEVDSLTSSCSNFSGATNFTVEDSVNDQCWIFAPSIDVVGGCGCANVTGNCTCDSGSLACTITFFDGTYGNIPPGSSAIYTYYPGDWPYPMTESYYCPLSYDPPAILITIICLVISGILTLLYLNKRYDPEFFQAPSTIKKIYRLGTILNMFWPSVHMSITMGYLYWLINSQTFTPFQVPAPESDTSDNTPYYILVNADWYSPNNQTIIIPTNSTTVNGQECYVSTDTEPWIPRNCYIPNNIANPHFPHNV